MATEHVTVMDGRDGSFWRFDFWSDGTAHVQQHTNTWRTISHGTMTYTQAAQMLDPFYSAGKAVSISREVYGG